MNSIGAVLEALKLQKSPNHTKTAKEFGVNHTTLSRRHRQITQSKANRNWQPGKALRTVLRAEHCNRFSTTGAYHRWIANGWINDWIILDRRHSRPQKYRMIASFLHLGPHG
jgi:hypothetical protein